MNNKNEFKDIAKKIGFAGIGAVAVAAEAAGKMLDKLSEKGEQVTTESKIINEGKKAVKDFKENVSKSQAKKAMEAVVDMTKEEREALRKKLDEFEAEIEKAVGDVADTEDNENEDDIEVEFYNDLKSEACESCSEQDKSDKEKDSCAEEHTCCCNENKEQ
ncbi:MAG: hypothetical protein ACTTKP_00495 [Catonella sp.]|uniref:hypothetical protein n=1 Tax=Catonella sp. TaxID=2382125 RepID=UPI003F9FFF3E